MNKAPPLFEDNSLDRFSKNDARINLDSEAPLVYIRYRDHFRSTRVKASSNLDVIESECVGWLERESSDAFCIVWDRSVTRLREKVLHPHGSGLVIFKSDVVELKQIEL